MSRYLEVSISADSTLVYGNEVLLQQAVLNLLYNAFDAVLHERSPAVILELNGSRESVVISVTDSGAGVSDDMIDRLFQPFESSLQKTSGMGLGLALARQIVEDHGGKISYQPPLADERLVSSGSVFVISIPYYNSSLNAPTNSI